MLRDECQKTCKGVDGRRDKDHAKIGGRLDLDGRRGGPHHESERPESVAWKWKGHDRAAAESRSEIQNVGHAFQGEIYALYERNLREAVFEPCHQALAQYMVGNDTDDDEEGHQEQQAKPWDWIGYVFADEVVQCCEEG